MSKMTMRIAILILLAGLFTSPAYADDAKVTVENLHAELLAAMRRAPELGYRGRYDLLYPTVNAAFDFETIGRIVTGAAWKTANEAQKAEFKAVFSTLSVATYATNFSGYNGEKFVTLGSEPKRNAIIVKTHLVKTDGEKISLNYMLREHNDMWLIVNVIAQGVSDLSLKRAEYSAVIQSEGFDSLTKRLGEKVKEMNHGS
jgi:phospholipid transport system substrate-binding protein